MLVDSNFRCKVSDFLGMATTQIFVDPHDPWLAPEAKVDEAYYSVSRHYLMELWLPDRLAFCCQPQTFTASVSSSRSVSCAKIRAEFHTMPAMRVCSTTTTRR